MDLYGFHLNDDREIRVEAETIHEAIKLAEEQTGAIVLRGSKVTP
jgi:hypothetical protein